MKKIYKRLIIVLLILAVTTVGLGLGSHLGLQIPSYFRLDRGLYNLFSPLIDLTARLYDSVTSYVFVLFNVGEIRQQNRELTREVHQLQNQVHQLNEALSQNERLEQMEEFLDVFREYMDYDVQGALIIGRSPTNQEDVWIINQGKRHGLEENMPVISYNGVLVGEIIEVGAGTAQVLPVHNPRFSVGGIIQDSRVLGLVRGQAEEKAINVMENIDPEAEIEMGNQVLTSGLSTDYPQYLPIGRIVNIAEDNYGLSQQAEIHLYSSQFTVEEVLVITRFGEEE